MISLSDIKAAYPEEKRQADKSEWLAYYFIRPLSFYCTWLLINLGLSANASTWFSLLAGLAGIAMLACPEFAVQVAGASLLIAWLILDHVDGNIARYHKQSSNYGDYIDTLAAYVILGFFPVGLSLSAYHQTDCTAGHWLIVLGGYAGVASILPRLAYQKMLNYGDSSGGYRKLFGNESGATLVKTAFAFVNNMLNPSGFLFLWVFLFVVLQAQDLFVGAYALIWTLLTPLSIFRFCRRLKRAE